MNETNQVAVDLIADPKGLKAGYDQALNEQKSFHERWDAREREAAQKWQTSAIRQQVEANSASMREGSEEAERYVKSLTDKAATLGMTRREIELYRASQMSLTVEQAKSVRASLDAIEAHERQAESMARLTTLATRLSAALASAAVTGLGFAVREAAQAERSEIRFDAIYRATGGTAGLSRAELGDFIDEMARKTVHSDETIRDAMARLMTFRTVSGETFKEVMYLGAGLAESLGTNLRGGVEALARALEEPKAGLMALHRAGVDFSPVQKKMIEDLMEHGRSAEALQIILQRLREKGFRDLAEDVNRPGGYTNAFTGAAKATGEFLEAIGKTSAVKEPVVGFLDAFTERMKKLKSLIENGTWTDRLVFIVSRGFILPNRPGAPADPQSDEAQAAHRASQQAQWARDFEAQQAGIAKFIEEQDKKDARLDASLGAQWQREDMHRAMLQAKAELDEFARQAKGDQALRDALAQPYVEAAKLAQEAADDMIYTWNDAGERVVMTKKQFADAEKESKKAFHNIRDTGSQAYRELQSAVEGWGRENSRALAKMTLDGQFSFKTLSDAARGFLEELIAIQYQQRLMAPYLQAGTRLLDDFFAGSNPGGPTGAEGMTGGTFHEGGIVGSRTPDRVIPRSIVARAPRYHSGYPGLRPNERVGVFLDDEEILTRRDPRHRFNGGMAAPKVTVNVINQAGAPVEAEQADVRMDADGMVVDLVIKRLAYDHDARARMGQLLDPRARR